MVAKDQIEAASSPPHQEAPEPPGDHTMEYNNSLVFANDSGVKDISETQNHGTIVSNLEIKPETRWEDTQKIPILPLPESEGTVLSPEFSPKVIGGPFSNDTLQDTQVIKGPEILAFENDETQVIGASPNKDIHRIIIPNDTQADTQLVHSPTRTEAADTQIIPNGVAFNAVIYENEADDTAADNTVIDDNAMEIDNTSGHTNEEAYLTFSQGSKQPHTSPTALNVGSFVEIPGTVERVTTTKEVEQSQEVIVEHEKSSSLSDNIESVNTDEEIGLQFVEDSLIAYRHKLPPPVSKDVWLERSSPYKATAEIERSPVSTQEEIKPAKKPKLNVLESPSQSQTSSKSSEQVFRDEAHTSLVGTDVIYPKSVWANHEFKMYPGTIVNSSETVLEVLFEEGVYDVKNEDLYPLDVRVGDIVRIKNSTQEFVVSGLISEPSPSNSKISCVRGFNQVCLKRTHKTKKNLNNEVVVPMSSLFMEINDWFQHQAKFKIHFNYINTTVNIMQSHNRTPTRNRHTHESKHDLGSPKRLRIAEGIFADSIFCITSVSDTVKEELTKLIYENGGNIIDEGFMELFTYHRGDRLQLHLRDDLYSKQKFVALISGGISRSSKYLQTVALGWPIVSDLFIFDTVKDNSNFGNWPSYLLGAGHSTIIGAVKSLDIYKFRLNYDKNLLLSKLVGINNHLLSNYLVVTLADVKSNKEILTCEFLFYAFGVKDFLILPNEKELIKYVESTTHPRNKILGYHSTKFKIEGLRTVDWEWVVQCCISNHIWGQ